MEQEFIDELQELQNLETAGETLDDTQQSRFSLLKATDLAEKTADKKSKDLESALAQKEHFRTKFEDLEKGKKSETIVKPEPTKESYSLSDIRALNDVPDEDVADVVEYAKFKGITIAEAKKTSVIKTLLAENAENRKVAEATNVKTTKRTMQKPNGSDVIADAEKGNFPTDPAELARARTEKLQAKR